MHVLIFWNEFWDYQIQSFNRDDITFDVINASQGLVDITKCSNAKNIFSYNGPAWNNRTKDDEENILNLYKKVLSENKYDYIFPAWMDSQLPALAIANEYYQLKGIKPISLERLSGKHVYGKILKKLNIRTPHIFESSESLKFPVICKPSFGTASEGIKICHDSDELATFLDNNEKLQPYIIQEYVQGKTVCFIGHISEHRVFIDLIYDIETSEPPYCIETGYKFPSAYEFITESVKNDIETFFASTGLNDSPFMLDLIVKPNGDYYFIDFSPRISYSIYQLMHYIGNSDYFYNLTNKILNGVEFNIKKEKCYLLRHFNFDAGIVESIEYTANDNIMEITLPKSLDTIREIKNDFDIGSNGYFCILIGNSLNEIEQSFLTLHQSIKLVYKF